MIQLYRETGKHSVRIIGDDRNELLDEAMKYVTKETDFYKRYIAENLLKFNNSVISKHSNAFGDIIGIYYDPEHKISKEDAENSDGREFYRKYGK